MITVSLDLGDTPSVLRALADPRLAGKAAKAAAEAFTDETLDWIAAGRAFTSRTGILEQSIGWRPTGLNAAEVYVNADYAPYVELGTRAHVIEPKPGRKGLKIPVVGGGGYIIRRSVQHPGSKPYPFFFADRARREQSMTARALSVLAAHAGV